MGTKLLSISATNSFAHIVSQRYSDFLSITLANCPTDTDTKLLAKCVTDPFSYVFSVCATNIFTDEISVSVAYTSANHISIRNANSTTIKLPHCASYPSAKSSTFGSTFVVTKFASKR